MAASFCSSCGTARPEGAAFCPSCGTAFAGAAAPEASAPAPPPASGDATVRATPQHAPPEPDAVSGDETVRAAPEASDPLPRPQVASGDETVRVAPPEGSGAETVRVPPEPPISSAPSAPEAAKTVLQPPGASSRAARPVPPVAPPPGPVPPVRPASSRAQGRPVAPPVPPAVPPEAPTAPAPTAPAPGAPASGARRPREAWGTPPDSPRDRDAWAAADPPLAPRRRSGAAKAALWGVGVLGGLALALVLALVIGQGAIERNSAEWVLAQAREVPGRLAFDDVESHPFQGHLTLVGARFTDDPAAPIGIPADDGVLSTSRIELDVPRAFFLAALFGRLPDDGDGPVEDLAMTAYDVSARETEFGEPVETRADEIHLDFDGRFDPDAFESGFDLSRDQDVRIEFVGFSTGTSAMAAFGSGFGGASGEPTTLDRLVLDGGWDAGRGRFAIREVSARGGAVEGTASGEVVLTPALRDRLLANDLAGAERLLDGEAPPFTEASFTLDVDSGEPFSMPVEDGLAFEVGPFEYAADVDVSVSGDVAAFRPENLDIEGTAEASGEGFRFVLGPDARADFERGPGQELGISAAQFTQPISFQARVSVDGQTFEIGEMRAESGFGAVSATGALQVVTDRPERSFFTRPMVVRFERLPSGLEGLLRQATAEIGLPLQNDGGALELRLDGTLENLGRL